MFSKKVDGVIEHYKEVFLLLLVANGLLVVSKMTLGASTLLTTASLFAIGGISLFAAGVIAAYKTKNVSIF